jgi:hypothetical protein
MHVTVCLNTRSYGHANGCHHAEMASWIRSGTCLGPGVTDDYDDNSGSSYYYYASENEFYQYTCDGNGE